MVLQKCYLEHDVTNTFHIAQQYMTQTQHKFTLCLLFQHYSKPVKFPHFSLHQVYEEK